MNTQMLEMDRDAHSKWEHWLNVEQNLIAMQEAVLIEEQRRARNKRRWPKPPPDTVLPYQLREVFCKWSGFR